MSYVLPFSVPVVNSPSRIVKSPQTPVEVMSGGNLTLECVAEASPVPVVTWEKYGGQLPEGRYTQKLGAYNLDFFFFLTFLYRITIQTYMSGLPLCSWLH